MSLLSCFGNDATIHAFEPSSYTFRRLQTNIPVGASVRLHNFGLGHQNETVELFFNDPGDQVATVYRQTVGDIHRRFNSETITLRRLDDVASELGVDSIDLLKIDVEGHEMKVLEGSRSLLERGD